MIRAHFNYGRGLLQHKLGVLRGCKIMGVPLWRAIVHDWTKLLPCEWFPYVRQFRNPDGTKRDVRNPDGSYDPAAQPIPFQRAWIHHQRNKHHFQAWISIGDDGKLSPVPIPETYLREMIADWIGAGIAYSNRENPYPWYLGNKSKMVLHPETEKRLEELMEQFKDRTDADL